MSGWGSQGAHRAERSELALDGQGRSPPACARDCDRMAETKTRASKTLKPGRRTAAARDGTRHACLVLGFTDTYRGSYHGKTGNEEISEEARSKKTGSETRTDLATQRQALHTP
jgi:hypothetical protein